MTSNDQYQLRTYRSILRGSEDPWLCVPDFGQVCLYRMCLVYAPTHESPQFGDVHTVTQYRQSNVRFGYLAALSDNISSMTALGWKADVKAARGLLPISAQIVHIRGKRSIYKKGMLRPCSPESTLKPCWWTIRRPTPKRQPSAHLTRTRRGYC